jgi:integrase
MQYITKRNSIYYFQRRIPKELSREPIADLLTSKKLFQTSLKTTNRKIALHKAAQLNLWFEEQLRLLRKPKLEADNVFLSLTQDTEVPREIDARQLVIEWIENEYKFSFDREPNQTLRSIPSEVRIALDRLKSAENGKKYLSLIQIAKECVEDMAQEGKVNKKSIPGKVIPAAKWLLSCLDLTDIELTKIETKHVKAAMRFSKNQKGLAPATINGHLCALRALWQFAHEDYSLPAQGPFTKMSSKGKSESYRRFYPEEIFQLYQLADDLIKPAIMIGATTGARISEATTMKAIRDSSNGRLYWSIKPDGDGKTASSTRVIPVHPKLAFVTEGYSLEVTSRTLTRHMRAAVDSLIKSGKLRTEHSGKLSFHSFRSHVASELAHSQGYRPDQIELFTGHRAQGSELKRKSTVHIYIQSPSKNLLEQMVDGLCWPFEN